MNNLRVPLATRLIAVRFALASDDLEFVDVQISPNALAVRCRRWPSDAGNATQ